MNNEDNNNVVEDVPEMRSVAIRSSARPALILPTPIAAKAPSRMSAPETKTVVGHSQSSNWTVGHSLKPIPLFYLVERTSTRIANASPDEIAARISDFLRAQSVAAKFHDEEALAEAETGCGLLFNVRLWQDQGDKVIVELQRKEGCCFLFNQCVKGVLRAAKGEAVPARRITFTVPDCVPQSTHEGERLCLEEGLRMASSLLKENRVDAHVLAVQSLMHISQVTQEKDFAAHCILCGEFQSTLVSLIESFHIDHKTYETVKCKLDLEALQQMHRYALTILANCLSALQSSGELAKVLEEQKELTSMKLLTALIKDAENACDKPHDACQAIRCIGSIGMTSSVAQERLAELGAPSVVDTAQKQGLCRHAKLAEECDRLKSLTGM